MRTSVLNKIIITCFTLKAFVVHSSGVWGYIEEQLGWKEQAAEEKISSYLYQNVHDELKLKAVLQGQEINTSSQLPIKHHNQNLKVLDLEAKPIEENSKNEKVLKKLLPGQDGRIRILNTTLWPYSAHGVIAVEFDGSVAWGTGTLIAPNLVLTAGHNLYNRSNKKEASKVRFLPALNGNQLAFNEPTVAKYYYPQEYISNAQEDYGLVVLNEPIGNYTGYYGLKITSPNIIKNMEINIYGYPGDKVVGKKNHYEMWGMKGPVKDIQNDIIDYELDTYYGQSGSGVWCHNNGDYHVIGVHVLGDSILGINKATLLNKKRYIQIQRWIENSLQQTVLKSLQEGFCFNNIIKINLRNMLLEDLGLKKLMRHSFPNLVHLDLTYNGITKEGISSLSVSKAPNLTHLDLSNNKIHTEGIEHIIRENFLKLTSLSLVRCGLDKDVIIKLAHSNYRTIHKLNLGNAKLLPRASGGGLFNKIYPWDLNSLKEANNDNFLNLTHLNLDNYRITDNFLEGLAGGNLNNISFLSLQDNFINEKGLKALLSKQFTNLKTLYLFGNKKLKFNIINELAIEYPNIQFVLEFTDSDEFISRI